MDEKQPPVNYPENKDCFYAGSGYCAAVGCCAQALLIDLQAAKGQPDTQARADAIISQAKAAGCTHPLSF